MSYVRQNFAELTFDCIEADFKAADAKGYRPITMQGSNGKTIGRPLAGAGSGVMFYSLYLRKANGTIMPLGVNTDLIKLPYKMKPHADRQNFGTSVIVHIEGRVGDILRRISAETLITINEYKATVKTENKKFAAAKFLSNIREEAGGEQLATPFSFLMLPKNLSKCAFSRINMINGAPTRVAITPHPTEETLDTIFTAGTQIFGAIDMSTLTHTTPGLKPSFTAKDLVVKTGVVQVRDIASTVSQETLLAMCAPVEAVTAVKESDETAQQADEKTNDQLEELESMTI